MAYTPGDFTQINVNTNSVDMYAGDVRLAVQFYDRNMSVSLTEATTDEHGSRRFPKENANKVLFTPDRVQVFKDFIVYGLLPAIAEKREYTVALPMNKDFTTLVQLNATADGLVSFIIHNGLDASRIPKKSTQYIFTTLQFLEKYDATSGEFEAGLVPQQGQLAIFAGAFIDFAFNLSGASAHITNYTNRYADKRKDEADSQVAAKLGVVSAGGRPYNTGGTYAAGQQNMAPPTPPQNVNSVADMFNPGTTAEVPEGEDLPF